MKLAITEQNGVCTLTGTGDVSEHDLQVLKAGVAKLLGSGKQRVIIDLPDGGKIPPEIRKEIAALVASGGGKVALKGDEKSAEAAQQFKADIRQKELAEADIKKRVEKLQKQNELLIEQLKTALQARRVPPGDAALRAEIASLEEKLAQFLGQKQSKGKS